MTAKMRYKGHTWEHNPKSLKVTLSDNISEQKLTGSRDVIRHTGTGARKISGEGQLCGDDCLHRFSQLLTLQSDSRSGILSIPDTKPFFAYFTGIKLLCEPSPKVITYAFEFVEDTLRGFIGGEKQYHITALGETLWDISYIYDTAIETLVNLNPDIKRVDELSEGSVVRVC